MSVRDLVDAIVNGDSLGIQQSFDQEMTARIADRMDAMRVEVAQRMFKEQAEIDEINEEFELSDFSQEEFDQLDEISGQTIASYHKKVSNPTSAARRAAAKVGKKQAGSEEGRKEQERIANKAEQGKARASARLDARRGPEISGLRHPGEFEKATANVPKQYVKQGEDYRKKKAELTAAHKAENMAKRSGPYSEKKARDAAHKAELDKLHKDHGMW